jgi:hypothetical protein
MAEELKPEDAEVIAKTIANEVSKLAERIMKRKFIRIDCKPCGGCRGKRSIRVNIPTFYMLLYLEVFYEAIFNEETPLCKLVNDPRINMLLRCIDTAKHSKNL